MNFRAFPVQLILDGRKRHKIKKDEYNSGLFLIVTHSSGDTTFHRGEM